MISVNVGVKGSISLNPMLIARLRPMPENLERTTIIFAGSIPNLHVQNSMAEIAEQVPFLLGLNFGRQEYINVHRVLTVEQDTEANVVVTMADEAGRVRVSGLREEIAARIQIAIDQTQKSLPKTEKKVV